MNVKMVRYYNLRSDVYKKVSRHSLIYVSLNTPFQNLLFLSENSSVLWLSDCAFSL